MKCLFSHRIYWSLTMGQHTADWTGFLSFRCQEEVSSWRQFQYNFEKPMWVTSLKRIMRYQELHLSSPPRSFHHPLKWYWLTKRPLPPFLKGRSLRMGPYDVSWEEPPSLSCSEYSLRRGRGGVWKRGRAWRRCLEGLAGLCHPREQRGLTGLWAHLIELCSDEGRFP